MPNNPYDSQLKAVITRYIGILNSQNLLSIDKVAEIIVSMMTDLQATLEEDLVKLSSDLASSKDRIMALENKLISIEGDSLGQVVRYVIGESLAKPGGLPADIDRLVQSSLKVEKGIINLSNELVHLIDRVDRLEKTEKESSNKRSSRYSSTLYLVFLTVATILVILFQ